jgi:hypothetical protein
MVSIVTALTSNQETMGITLGAIKTSTQVAAAMAARRLGQEEADRIVGDE